MNIPILRLIVIGLVSLLTACGLHAKVFDYNSTRTGGWATRINLPDDLPEIRGLVIIGNGAGGSSIGDAENAEYVAFARAHGFGVMAFGRWGNLYSSAERDRFLAALSDFATRANRPELVNVPWVAFGFSQGGGQAYSLNYHFPSRTIAIGVNKAGYSFLNGGYDTGRLDQTGVRGRPASPGALKTPALLVAGDGDEQGRITNLTNAYTNNSAQGAPWAMLTEQGVGHGRGIANQWILPFLDEAITQRYPAPMSARDGPPALENLSETISIEFNGSWLDLVIVDHEVKMPGLLGEYFDYTSPLTVLPDLKGRRPDKVRFEQMIDFANSPTVWSGLPATMLDTFAARFSGKIQIPSTGDYTFSVNSDDGSELWIDGKRVVANGGIHPLMERQGTVRLAAGAHDIKLLYLENTGWAGLTLSWQGPGISKQVVPASALFTVLSSGINAEYFDHASALSAIPAMERLTPQLTFIEDQLNEPAVPGVWPGLPASMQDTFSSRYNGFIRVEKPGTYQFHLASDDGSSLHLNGAQLLLSNRIQGMAESTVNVELKAGWHHFWIEYFENFGAAGLILSWTPPGGSKQVIPASAYFRLNPQ